MLKFEYKELVDIKKKKRYGLMQKKDDNFWYKIMKQSRRRKKWLSENIYNGNFSGLD